MHSTEFVEFENQKMISNYLCQRLAAFLRFKLAGLTTCLGIGEGLLKFYRMRCNEKIEKLNFWRFGGLWLFFRAESALQMSVAGK